MSMHTPTLATPFFVGFLAVTAAAQLAPDKLQYQFNEIRGMAVANTASTTALPANGTVTGSATWQSDPGRRAFRGNEAGFGCLGYRASGNSWIHTGWQINHTGSLTIMFWMRRDPASTSTNPFGYAFGDVSFRAFAAGAAGSGITFRGSPIGNVDSGFTVTGTPGVWQHVALVVDDVNGQALWFDNGTPSSNVISFTPNTFTYTGTRFMAVAAQGDSGLSPFGVHYDMDDFRYYGRALTQPEIMAAMVAENPSAGTFGSSCAGPGGAPQIGATGLPQLGNPTFSIDLANAEDSRLCVLALGLQPAAFGTFDLSPALGAGCTLQVDPFSLLLQVVVATAATQPMPIPNNAALHGLHVYGQWIIAGSTGAVTQALDVNIQ